MLQEINKEIDEILKPPLNDLYPLRLEIDEMEFIRKRLSDQKENLKRKIKEIIDRKCRGWYEEF